MLASQQRIKKKKEFDCIFKKGHSFYIKECGIRFFKNGLSYNRFAFIVPVKVSKKAVVRNKIRRRISEIIRLNLDKIVVGYDIVFIARPDINKKEYSDIERIIFFLLQKNKMFVGEV